MLPNDPMILLSYINTKLRDDYPSLDALCDDLQADKAEIEQKLGAMEYTFDMIFVSMNLGSNRGAARNRKPVPLPRMPSSTNSGASFFMLNFPFTFPFPLSFFVPSTWLWKPTASSASWADILSSSIWRISRSSSLCAIPTILLQVFSITELLFFAILFLSSGLPFGSPDFLS